MTHTTYLVGHSWGSLLGLLLVQRHPDRFYAFAGLGQCSNIPEGEALAYEHLLRLAREASNTEAVLQLELIGAPVNGVHQGKYSNTKVKRKWLVKSGCSLSGKTSLADLKLKTLFAKEYSLFDRLNFIRGSSMPSLAEFMEKEVLGFDLSKAVPQVEVPVYFFLGRHDYVVPSVLAERYLELLQAPEKELVWFENSAHSPCFEEPEKFNELIVTKFLGEA